MGNINKPAGRSAVEAGPDDAWPGLSGGAFVTSVGVAGAGSSAPEVGRAAT